MLCIDVLNLIAKYFNNHKSTIIVLGTPEDFMTDQKKLTAYLQNYEKENSKSYSS